MSNTDDIDECENDDTGQMTMMRMCDDDFDENHAYHKDADDPHSYLFIIHHSSFVSFHTSCHHLDLFIHPRRPRHTSPSYCVVALVMPSYIIMMIMMMIRNECSRLALCVCCSESKNRRLVWVQLSEHVQVTQWRCPSKRQCPWKGTPACAELASQTLCV